MKVGDVWFKRRQKSERERFFVIKKNSNSGFRGFMMAKGSYWEKCFIDNEAIEGFEKRNKLLTESEIAKHILLGNLNPKII